MSFPSTFRESHPWQEPQPTCQISLAKMFEVVTVCSVFLATYRLNHLVALTFACGVATVWASQAGDWRLRISLMMIFAGSGGVTLGLLCVLTGFHIIDQTLSFSSLSNTLVLLGPMIGYAGAFHVIFGAFHLVAFVITTRADRSNAT